MAVTDLIIVIVLIGGILLVANYWGKMKDWFPGEVIDMAKTILNPDSYSDKAAPFCCDVFTTDQILQMSAREYMPCNNGCNRSSPGCFVNADNFNNLVMSKPIKHSGQITLNPNVKGCQGMVSEGTV